MATGTADAGPAGPPRRPRRRRRRRHGLESPLHPQQVCGWVALGVLGAGAFLLLVPALSAPLRTPFRATLASLFAVHLASHLAATLLDPAEPELRRQPRPKDPQPLPPGAAPISRGRCRLCEIRLSGARTKHCGACDKCVAGFDHHCKWLNQCVGARNYAVFAVSVATAAAGSTLMAAVAAVEVALLHSSSPGWWIDPPPKGSLPFGGGTAFQAAVVVLGVLSAVAAALLLHLGAFHVYIAVRGLTTYEYIRSHRNAVAPVSFPSNQQPNISRASRSGCCKSTPSKEEQRNGHHTAAAERNQHTPFRWRCCNRASEQPGLPDVEQQGVGKSFGPYVLPPPDQPDRKCSCCLEENVAPQKQLDSECRESLENAGRFDVKWQEPSYLASPSRSSRKFGCCGDAEVQRTPRHKGKPQTVDMGSPVLPRTFVSYLFCALGSRETSEGSDLPSGQQVAERSIIKPVSSYNVTPHPRSKLMSCCGGSGSDTVVDQHELEAATTSPPSPDGDTDQHNQSSSFTSCKCCAERRCCAECSQRPRPRCSLCMCVGGGSRVSPDTRGSCSRCCHRPPPSNPSGPGPTPPTISVIGPVSVTMDKDLLKAPVPRRRWTSAVCGVDHNARPELLPPPPPTESPPCPPQPSRPPCSLPALPPPTRRRIRSATQLQELSAALARVQDQPDLAVLRQAFVSSQRRQQRLRTLQQQQRARSPRLSPIRESGLSNPGSPVVTMRSCGAARAGPRRADTDPTPESAAALPTVRSGTWLSAEHAAPTNTNEFQRL